jgi:hypothetical protein
MPVCFEKGSRIVLVSWSLYEPPYEVTVTVLFAAALAAGLEPQPDNANPAIGVRAAALSSCLRSKGRE